MRTAPALLSLPAVALLLAVPASAKDGVRAELVHPVDLAAAPGTRMTVDWRLQDAAGRPFGAGGIYLRVGRCGRRVLRVRARAISHGRYSATFTVPGRGIRKLTVGLKGWRMYPSGRTERADAIFRFDPPLRRSCP